MALFKSNSRRIVRATATRHTQTKYGYRAHGKTSMRHVIYGVASLLVLGGVIATLKSTFAATPSEPSYRVMIQVSSLSPSVSTTQLKSYLEDIRLKHRNTNKPAYINRVVLQDIADKNGNLYKPYLDVIAPYLPGGATPAFDQAYVGTVDLAWTGAGSKYIEGIEDAGFRATNVNTSKIAAAAFRKAYPKNVYDWYVTYEANLAGFWDKKIESAYLTYMNTLIPELNKIYPRGNVLWSPAFWTTLANEPAWALPDLKTNLGDLFTNVKPALTLDLQDFVGQSNGVTKKEDAVAWINYLKQNFPGKFNRLELNAEQFKQVNGVISVGDSVEVPSRMAYYKTQGVGVGPSWEIRYWHKRLYGN